MLLKITVTAAQLINRLSYLIQSGQEIFIEHKGVVKSVMIPKHRYDELISAENAILGREEEKEFKPDTRIWRNFD